MPTPLHNEATVAIKCSDLLGFLSDYGHDPVIVEFDAGSYRIRTI